MHDALMLGAPVRGTVSFATQLLCRLRAGTPARNPTAVMPMYNKLIVILINTYTNLSFTYKD